MKIETHETEVDTYDDGVAIAKRWYTEQRGRRLGNTVAWDDLGEYGKSLIITRTMDLLYAFRVSMQPEPTPVEQREKK